MTTIKQIFLGAAVAGVVAGTGSAVATAVAYAEPGASDTNNASGATAGDDSSHEAAPSRSRGRVPAAASAPAPAAAVRGGGATAGDATDAPVPTGIVRAQSTVRGQGDSDPVLPDAHPAPESITAPAPNTEAPAAPVSVSAPAAVNVEAPAAVPRPSGPAPGPAASTPAPASSAPAVIAVEAPRAAAAVVLTPAPEPEPLGVPLLPLLPTLPVVPVAPAGAVSVSSVSGTDSRIRAASAVAQAAVLTDPPVNHVLLIGTDGTNLSKILEYAYDNPDVNSGFKLLMDQGITGATSLIGHTTISGPSWSTIMTGAWDNKTGVINNLFSPKPYDKWPTAINLLEYTWGSKINTAVFADWKYITDMAKAGGYAADVDQYVAYREDAGWEAADDEVTAKTIAYIQNTKATDPTFVFSYQVAVDEEGHLHGGGSPEYRAAVINTAENIADIIGAVNAWEAANPGQEWSVIVTTDHGHQQSQGFGHGFQSPNETSSFIIFDQAGDDSNDGKQNMGYKNTDITPTILSLFNVAQRSDFDGVPLQTKTAGIVAPLDLKTSLQDSIAMYGYPNIGTDLALGTRTVFASVPYLIDGLVNDLNGFLQGIVDRDIFLISGLADISQWIVQFNGDLAVGVTQALARVVATLTGSGTIAPTDPPLPPKSGSSELPWVLDANAVLT